MSNLGVQVTIDLATVIASMLGASFVAGNRWGRIEGDIRAMSSRLARIEGMFVLKLRNDEHDQQG